MLARECVRVSGNDCGVSHTYMTGNNENDRNARVFPVFLLLVNSRWFTIVDEIRKSFISEQNDVRCAQLGRPDEKIQPFGTPYLAKAWCLIMTTALSPKAWGSSPFPDRN